MEIGDPKKNTGAFQGIKPPSKFWKKLSDWKILVSGLMSILSIVAMSVTAWNRYAMREDIRKLAGEMMATHISSSKEEQTDFRAAIKSQQEDHEKRIRSLEKTFTEIRTYMQWEADIHFKDGKKRNPKMPEPPVFEKQASLAPEPPSPEGG